MWVYLSQFEALYLWHVDCNVAKFQEQDIPIEIAVTKLLEWMESRKVVPKNWSTHIREIRSKITNALNDMPVHNDLVKLLSGSCNYQLVIFCDILT